MNTLGGPNRLRTIQRALVESDGVIERRRLIDEDIGPGLASPPAGVHRRRLADLLILDDFGLDARCALHALGRDEGAAGTSALARYTRAAYGAPCSASPLSMGACHGDVPDALGRCRHPGSPPGRSSSAA